MVKFRKNDNWDFKLIVCSKNNIKQDLIKKLPSNSDIIETEVISESTDSIEILVKYALI
jgi:hypothetical protein